MSFDGGFGAVVWVRGALVRDLLAAIHFNQSRAFATSVSRTFVVAGTTVTVSGDVSLDAPNVALRRVDGAARVDLTAWARLTVSGGAQQEQCVVKLTAQVLAPFAFDPPTPFLVRNTFLDLSQFTVVSADVEVPWTSVDPAVQVNQLSLDPAFVDFLVDTLRPLAQSRLRIALPIDAVDRMAMQANAALALVPNARPAAVFVHDDCLAVCVDLFDGSTLISPGDVNALEQPWDGWAARKTEQQTLAQRPFVVSPNDVQVVVAVNAGILQRYATLDARLQLQKAIGDSGADVRIDDFRISLGRGEVDFTVTATGQAPDPFPAVSGSGLIAIVPMHDFIFLLRTDADFSSSGLVGLFDDATGLLTGLLRSALAGAAVDAVRRVNFMLPQAGFSGDLPFAGGSPGNAQLGVKLEGLAVDPGFALIGLMARVFRNEFQSDPLLDDPTAVPRVEVAVLPRPDGQLPTYAASKHPLMGKRLDSGMHLIGIGGPLVAHIRDRHLRFSVADHPALRQIAALRLRWILTSGPADAPTLERVLADDWLDAAGSRAADVDLWDPELNGVRSITVTAAWYTPPFDPGRLVASNSRDVSVFDRFDRTHPFARWTRSIQLKMPAPDESGVITTQVIEVDRPSAVHKTAMTERCRFSDAGFEPRFGRIEALDALPAPEVPDLRSSLCEFCFPVA